MLLLLRPLIRIVMEISVPDTTSERQGLFGWLITPFSRRLPLAAPEPDCFDVTPTPFSRDQLCSNRDSLLLQIITTNVGLTFCKYFCSNRESLLLQKSILKTSANIHCDPNDLHGRDPARVSIGSSSGL